LTCGLDQSTVSLSMDGGAPVVSGCRAVRALLAAAVLVAVGLGAGGCAGSPGVSTSAVIRVDHATALADQPVRVRITGLAPHDEVAVTARATDYIGNVWESDALFRADATGTVDLGTAAPLSGSYHGADAMGLFWSMDPEPADAPAALFSPTFPQDQSAYPVRIAVSAHGRSLATRDLVRRWLAAGVTDRALTVADDKVDGELFLPAPGAGRHPAVLVFGGSEGGDGQTYTAALLASHGYPALALGYFDLPGLPSTLQDISLEYFATAARILAAQPGVDPAHILAMGYSRGSEAALLLADDYPTLIHGAVVYSPSAQVNPGFPSGPTAWTRGGRPVPLGKIPLNRVSGPVLAVAGADDLLWPSPSWAREIAGEPTADHGVQAHQALVYPNAGHLVGTFPYLPADTAETTALGGTLAGDAAAQAAGWPQVLSLLNRIGAR
jgi:dienelactone hydrolase